jgi:hypothetical protein
MTLPKQEWKRKGAPRSSTVEPATGEQTATSDDPTAIGSGSNGSTMPSGGLTALAQEAHSLNKDQSNLTAASRSQHIEAGGQIVSPGGPIASSCSPTIKLPAPAGPTTNSCSPTVRPPALAGPTIHSCSPIVRPPASASLTASSYRTGANSSADGTSSPAAMEEDIDDHLQNYEPSPAQDGIEINVIYHLSFRV